MNRAERADKPYHFTMFTRAVPVEWLAEQALDGKRYSNGVVVRFLSVVHFQMGYK